MATTSDRPRAAVHVDMDGLTAIARVHGWPAPTSADHLFQSGTDNTLRFLDDVGLKATFFVIADDLDNTDKATSVRAVVDAGHEIGSHTLSHEKLTALDRDRQVREVADSREKLENRLGVPVRGFRAPAFDINAEVYRLIADAGYEYDSSLFPNTRSARAVGFPSVPSRPSRLLPDSGLIEVPLPSYAPLPVPFHASYSLVFGTWYFGAGMRRCADAPLIFLLHLTDLAAPVRTEGKMGFSRTLFTISHLGADTKWARCRAMLDRARDTHDFGTTRQLIADAGLADPS